MVKKVCRIFDGTIPKFVPPTALSLKMRPILLGHPGYIHKYYIKLKELPKTSFKDKGQFSFRGSYRVG